MMLLCSMNQRLFPQICVAAGPSSTSQPMDPEPEADANQAYIREMRTQDQVCHCNLINFWWQFCVPDVRYHCSLWLASVRSHVHTVSLWCVLHSGRGTKAGASSHSSCRKMPMLWAFHLVSYHSTVLCGMLPCCLSL